MDLKTSFFKSIFFLDLQHQTIIKQTINHVKETTYYPWDNIPRVHHGDVPRLYGNAALLAVVDDRLAVSARRPGA
jgi:hypothetical protein